MDNPGLASIILSLGAATAWGAGDFTGGLLSRRTNVFGVVVGGQLVGLLVLLCLALVTGENLPTSRSWILACIAGLGGGFGLTLLYRALAGGQMSVAAPVSAVMAAVIPVLYSLIVHGMPGWLTSLGLALALVAIWLVARGGNQARTSRLQMKALSLPLLAGVVFGFFFLFLNKASQESVLWPVIATRLTSILFLTLIAAFKRQPWLPKLVHLPLLALNGLLDTAGNSLYVLAGQLGRLDVAVVLSSLYPASTVLLAWLLLKEKLSRTQRLGVAVALASIVLMVV